MDAHRFDALTRLLSGPRSRRGLTAALGGLIGLGALPVAAKKKKKKVALCLEGQTLTVAKKAKKKYLKRGATLGACQPSPTPSGCTPDCSQKVCGDDGCGGSCGACGGGEVCAGGRCAAGCPSGQRPCRGACLAFSICCDTADCAGGRTCQQGTCACPADKPLLCPGSQVCAQCCTVDDCRPANNLDGQVCAGGVCTCTIEGTERCPEGSNRARLCGFCCNHSECTGGTVCAGVPPQCRCVESFECGGSCVSPTCVDLCFAQCDTPGKLCCGGGASALTCREDGGPGSGSYSCQP